MARRRAELPRADGPAAVPRRARASARPRDTWTLELEPRRTASRSACAPGQFTMLYAFGIGEVPISVSGDAGGPLVHTVRAVGAGEPRRSARLEARRGARRPRPLRQRVAGRGGDRAATRRDRRRRDRPRAAAAGRLRARCAGAKDVRRGRSCSTAAARPADLLYARELERWRKRLQVDLIVDAADQTWTGKVGFVAKLVSTAPLRSVEGDRVRLRPRADDADERRGADRARRLAARGSTSRWSATCTAAWATAATASSARR